MNPEQHAPPTRLAGLDTLRAIAIVWVMLYHFRIQGLVPESLDAVARTGWVGVDLFFVLSGFLIGAQLLKPFAAGARPSLVEFYVSRSLRILPAFLVVLLLYLLVPGWREAPGPYAPWQYLTFTWNLLMLHFPEARAFSHVWSLCVEEHFYLLLPPLLLVLRPPLSRRRAVLLVIGLVCAGIALRAWLLWHVVLAPSEDEDAAGLRTMRFIYYPTYARLDGLAIGVALAALRVFAPHGWRRIAAFGHMTAAAGLLCVLAALWTCDWNYVDADRPASILFAFPLLAFGFGCLLLSATSRNGWLNRRMPGAYMAATLAFSLYLTHKAIAHILRTALPGFAPGHPWAMLLFCFVASSIAAAVLYRIVELPFLRLRSRWLDHRPANSAQARLDPAL